MNQEIFTGEKELPGIITFTSPHPLIQLPDDRNDLQ